MLLNKNKEIKITFEKQALVSEIILDIGIVLKCTSHDKPKNNMSIFIFK